MACIYLDPRYKVLLNEEKKTLAIAHLQNTWISLQNLKSQSLNFTDQNRLSPAPPPGTAMTKRKLSRMTAVWSSG